MQKLKAIFTPAGSFAKDYAGKQKFIKTLMDAMLEQRTSLVEYHSFSDDKMNHLAASYEVSRQ